VNRSLAHRGSIDGSVATIDLSEASDRVSLPLVNALFASDSVLLENILAFRSTHVKLPGGTPFGGRIVPLRKYSTSGSALTFPVETLVFFILSLSAAVEVNLHRFRDLRAAISSLARTVNVYGDDIVVPTDSCSQVMDRLEANGLKVNRGKTFWKGLFRESCGGDYFKGQEVTPTYLKHDLPNDLTRADPFESAVANRNLFFKRGFWHTADTIRKAIDAIYRLPVVLPTCPGLGWVDLFDRNDDTHTKVKVFENHIPKVRTVVSRTKAVPDQLDGYGALLKHFLSRGVQEDRDHLDQTVPRYRSRLSIKWVTPF